MTQTGFYFPYRTRASKWTYHRKQKYEQSVQKRDYRYIPFIRGPSSALIVKQIMSHHEMEEDQKVIKREPKFASENDTNNIGQREKREATDLFLAHWQPFI